MLSNYDFTTGRLINATHRSNRTRRVSRRLTSCGPVFIATLVKTLTHARWTWLALCADSRPCTGSGPKAVPTAGPF